MCAADVGSGRARSEEKLLFSNDAKAWYAIQVRTEAEKLVSSLLGQKGHETFLPLRRESRRWSDRRVTVECAMFPGYLFCQMDPRFRLPVLTTPGVFGIVGFGKVPQPVSQTEIERIRMLAERGVEVQPWPYLQAGQNVVIRYGPLRGLQGMVVKLKNECRLVVSVSLLQRSVAVEIDSDWLEISPSGSPMRMSA